MRPAVVDAMRDPHAEVFVSVVTPWELAIKVPTGRLPLPSGLETWLPDRLGSDQFKLLDIRLQHVLAVEHLPRHHGDPFDRLLVAQAQVEGLTIVTADTSLTRYDVPVLRC